VSHVGSMGTTGGYSGIEARNGYVLTQAFSNLTRLGDIGGIVTLGL
jgi:hypothetical protein